MIIIISCIKISEVTWTDEFTAIASTVLALFAFASILVQIYQFKKLRREEYERAYKTNSVTLIMDYNNQFDELDKERANVGKHIIKNDWLTKKEVIDLEDIKDNLADIFDVFDTLGYLVEHEYIKPGLFHQYFDYWFSNYYELYVQFNLKTLMGYDKSVWDNMPKLAEKLNKIEQEILREPRKLITIEKLNEFFTEESGIV